MPARTRVERLWESNPELSMPYGRNVTQAGRAYEKLSDERYHHGGIEQRVYTVVGV